MLYRYAWTQSVYARLSFKVGYEMTLENCKIVLYRQEDGSWVAEIPAISGCYALMPSREQALEELSSVFRIVSEEYKEKSLALPPQRPAAAEAALS
jgi:predicted RNase H-like HicB family nuclease